jgi:hypothetical protein
MKQEGRLFENGRREKLLLFQSRDFPTSMARINRSLFAFAVARHF